MKQTLLLLLGVIFIGAVSGQTIHTQNSLKIGRVEKCIRDYQDYSSLGNPGSVFIDSASISSFRDLFEPNAGIFWDLYTDHTRKSNFLLQVDEYIDSVNVLYHSMKPVISYGKYSIQMNPDGISAIVYLIKTNALPDVTSPSNPRFVRNIVTLRLLINIYGDVALIQNITPDNRLTTFRSLYAVWGYPFVSGLSSGFFGNPSSKIDPGIVAEYQIGRITGFSLGFITDLRFDRRKSDGLSFTTGLIYNRSEFNVFVNQYLQTSRQVFDPGVNAFECTVFDRSPSVTENVTIQSLSIPLTLKWYLFTNRALHSSHSNADVSTGEALRTGRTVRVRYYLRAGPQINLMQVKSRAAFELSHTGGGWVIYEKERHLPVPEQRRFYLDEQNERRDAPNFFVNQPFENNTSLPARAVMVSAVMAAGFEVKFNKLLIGFEPWFQAGLTSLLSESGKTSYTLYPADSFSGFLETYKSLKINSFGLNVIVGKLFYRKY